MDPLHLHGRQGKKKLVPTKLKIQVKKEDFRQCRLCLRVLPRVVTFQLTAATSDLRQRIMDTVRVQITPQDKLRSVCVNCLLVVEIISDFQATCLQTNTLHETQLLMMHPGVWMSDENKQIVANCQKLVKKNREEIDGLFQCSGLLAEEDLQLIDEEELALEEPHEPNPQLSAGDIESICDDEDVVQEESQDLELEAGVKIEHANDCDSEETIELFVKLDAPVEACKSDKNAKNYMCDVCGEMMQSSYAESHQNRLHSKIRPYMCPESECGKTFPSKYFLSIHLKKRHQSEVPIFECSTCSKKIKGKSSYAFHLKTHKSELHPLKVECNVCGKYFYKRYIKDHMFVHTGELPYSCEFCDRKYAAKTNWIAHRKKKHPNEIQVAEASC